MRGSVPSLLLFGCFLLAQSGPLHAQDKTPPPPQGQPEKVEKADPPTPAAPPGEYKRDGTSMMVYYLLAAIGTVLIMVLICMPVRRE